MKFPINHDLHCHTCLSACSGDPAMTAAAVLEHARRENYDVQCITDHLWDSAVPGASGWYAPQDIAHVRQNLPLPTDSGVRMVFGCETEYTGGGRVALSGAHFDEFQFIIIPPNHFHMTGLTRPAGCCTEEAVAELFTSRLEELSSLPLPWKKVGIAHLTCGLTFREGDCYAVFRRMDGERLKPVFRRFAHNGAGIELNAGCFSEGWREHEEEILRLYRIARDEGCRFYCGSDAHHPGELDISCLREAADALELTEKERYLIP